MTISRSAVAAAIVFAAMGLARPVLAQAPMAPAFPTAPAEPPPIAGETRVSSVKVERVEGAWRVSVDYFYTGLPKRAMLVVQQFIHRSEHPEEPLMEKGVHSTLPQRGAHTFTAMIVNPNEPGAFYTTERIEARIIEPGLEGVPKLASSADVSQTIRWPDQKVMVVDAAVESGKPQMIVDEAVQLIDSEDRSQIAHARTLLQLLIERNPRVETAYLELARVAMKLNWGPAGLADAERLIKSALQIRPDSADAKILLGYVRTHQRRYAEAEALFTDAARSNPPNLWLWSNWGELLAREGKADAAIEKYREAIKQPPVHASYDRARIDAYFYLIDTLEARGDLDGAEALHTKRTKEYPEAGCYTISYAKFLVLQRGKAESGLAVLHDGQLPQCEFNSAREVLGLAHYLIWATDAKRPEAFHQAQAFLPVGPRAFLGLASSERTIAAARKLLAAGEKIDIRDNEQMDALAYALRDGDAATAKRLLQLGARPDAPEGVQGMPAALIPVLGRDPDGIRLMQKAGIDYAKLRFQGTTAIDYARSQGDEELLKMLDPRGGKL